MPFVQPCTVPFPCPRVITTVFLLLLRCRTLTGLFIQIIWQERIRLPISMDGKGRWLDNVYVERLWRSLKQEEVYRRAYETVSEAGKGTADYLRYFNEERPHQGLDNRTPTTYSTNDNKPEPPNP